MYVSTGQDKHGTLSLLSLYFPTAHAVHGPPKPPSNPTLHVQFVTSVAPTSGS
jgi:hypothetical protein